MKNNFCDFSAMPANMIKYHNGYPYISDDADKAPIKIGSRVKKINSNKGDISLDGTEGKVIGSISLPIMFRGCAEHGYTILWDNKPNIPIATIGRKLQVIK